MFEPESLLRQCLGVIRKCEIEPEDRYQIFKQFSNMEINDELNEFLNNFVTELTYREIVDLKLDSETEIGNTQHRCWVFGC